MPVLFWYTRSRSPAVTRCVIYSVDSLLNMDSCFVFPLMIFWPYYRLYNVSTGAFMNSLMYKSVWLSQWTSEMQMIFALSLPDLLSKMLNHLSVFFALFSISALLQIRSPQASVGPFVKALIARPDYRFNGSKTIVSAFDRASFEKVANSDREYDTYEIKAPRWVTLLHFVSLVWGVIILVLFGNAVNRTSTPLIGCKAMAPLEFRLGIPVRSLNSTAFRGK